MNRLMMPTVALLALGSLARAHIPELEAPIATSDDGTTRPAALEPAPRDARRLDFPVDARALMQDLDAWFSVHPTHRVHARLDRPMYRPGDTVSLRAWTLATRGMGPQPHAVTAQLVDPRGTVVQTQRLDGHGAFTLPADAVGGSWKVNLTAPDGSVVDRPFVVSSFQAPRVKKTLAFARDGYGPGERVQASVTLERATGEKLAGVAATARVQADGVALDPIAIRTDASGAALITFTLPTELAAPDVLLTVLVDDGGVTESISRAVPVVLDRVTVAFFPEGGDLVAGLPSRVYFEGTDAHGEPADVAGELRDDRGRRVASFASWVDGRGHVTFTPEPGRTYTAHVDRAAGDDALFPLPEAKRDGCVLHHHDDLDGVQQALRVTVACSEARDVVVIATQQEQILDRAALPVAARRPTTVHLRSGAPALSGAQGVARVTVLDSDLQPQAERLVFRNKSRRLSIDVRPDRASYSPGDPVSLTVRTRDPEGRAVPAELSLAVVDDALLALADDDEHTLMSRVLLQADLPEPIEDAAGLFAPDAEDGGLGLDLVLGTRGWRRFDWTPVRGLSERLLAQRRAEDEARHTARRYRGRRAPTPSVDAPAMPMMLDALGYVGAFDEVAVATGAAATSMPQRPDARPASGKEKAAAAPVATRQFAPPPNARADAPEARSDFRDTVHWEPALRTGADGVARVRFHLSDAVTGFRAVAEGVGGGWIGQGDATLSSTLPLSVDARVPQALSFGDRLLLPVTLENRRSERVTVDLGLDGGDLLRAGVVPGDLALAGGERRTVHVPLTAAPALGTAELTLTARAGSRSDGLVQRIPIAPRGFPLSFAASGVVEGRVEQVVTVDAPLEGSITGRITLFPSTVSVLTEGVESMVRQPGGCFEQTSSTNYPNVVILDMLDRAGRAGSLQIDRQQVLQTGYRLLTGYQVASGGFETFGSGPGKEALSAYGLLEFADMSKVFPVDRKVIDDNVKYLYQQRDGKGGYRITGASSHGYGTAPPEVLDAYITFALVETGHRDLGPEVDAQSALARRSSDPYRLALATMTLLATRPAEGKAAAKRLAGLQAEDGSFPGSETSITRSENQNLLVEATALSTMALLRAGERGAAAEAVGWFQDHQTGAGVWGATQGNALALKAIAEASEAAGRLDGPGHLTVLVDGKPAGEGTFQADQDEPLVVELRGLTAGRHTVTLALDQGALPYALEVGWASEVPHSAPERRVDLETRLSDADLSMGETSRLTATLTNRTREVVPDPIARIGLPAGLEAQVWQLEQLVDRGDIAFFETRPREVTLYWHGIGRDEVHEVALDLVAIVPGTFTGPASSAYPYYDDQARAWTVGIPVSITP
jgi:alpha-2-macroglobulin-like protein